MTRHSFALDVAATLDAQGVNDDDLELICERLKEEVAELEPVATAAVLVTVAFRLKDDRGLVTALRKLAQAVDRLEDARDEA
jgi:hypothetical protein